MLERAGADGPVYLAGDFAGGGLALAATQTWIAAGGPRPAGLTLISPWLDAALTNPATPAVATRDPWLTVEAARVLGRAWAAHLPDRDPPVSPIRGDVDNLPHIDLYTGDRDILQPDCWLLRDTVPDDRLTYHQQQGGLHVYPLRPVPEASPARQGLLSHIHAALRFP